MITSFIGVFFNTSFLYLYLQVSYFCMNFSKLIFLVMLCSMWDLPCGQVLPAVEAWSLYHWMAREVPVYVFPNLHNITP